jgi:hypothetical protein
MQVNTENTENVNKRKVNGGYRSTSIEINVTLHFSHNHTDYVLVPTGCDQSSLKSKYKIRCKNTNIMLSGVR